MMKKLRYLLIPALLLLPILAWASDPSGVISANKELFYVSDTSPTVNYLAQLFGTVGNTLHASSGQLLGHVFKIFNVGVMVIAGLSFIITIVTTVVHTAHEGRFMGARQSKPAFTILRTTIGFSALVPMPSGYSLIQILTMSIILHGVGFANSAWNVAMDYFNDGGVVLMPPSTNTADNVNLAGTVLEAQVCMFHQEREARQKLKDDGDASKTIHTFTPVFAGNTVRFPSTLKNKGTDAGCGEFTWDAGDAHKNGYLKNAMQQLINDTQISAKHIVYPNSRSTSSIKNAAVASVVGGAADWVSYTLPVRGKRDKEVQDYLQKAKERGWMFAGAYYYGLTALQSKLDDDARWQFTITKPILGISATSSGSSRYISFPDKARDFSSLISPEIKKGGSPTLGDHYSIAANYISYAIKGAKIADKKIEGGIDSVVTPDTGRTPLGGLVNPVLAKLNAARQALFYNKATNMDPVLQLQSAGNALMDIMTFVWVSMAVIIFGISSGLSLFSGVSSLGWAFRDMLNFFLPLFMVLCVTLFVQGMVMAIYIPMIPFIIFTFAVMGWFAVCVESMVAAPLVALGLAHHEGHDMWGRSEEAIWLLLNVFLRPILMVIGLLSGMLVSRIGLKFLNVGFAQIISDVHKKSHAFAAVAELMMFIMLVTTVVHVSYSLIHRIPDKVMRWLKSGGDQMGEFVNQATKGAQDGVQQVAQQRGKMGSQSLSAGEKSAFRMGRYAEANNRPDNRSMTEGTQSSRRSSKKGGKGGGTDPAGVSGDPTH